MLKKRLLVAVILAVAVFAVLSLLLQERHVASAPPRPVQAVAPAPQEVQSAAPAPPPVQGAAPAPQEVQRAAPPPRPLPPNALSQSNQAEILKHNDLVGSVGAAAPAPPPAGGDFSQLVQGHAIWQGPKQMTDGDTAPVAISIGSTAVAAAALQQSLQSTLGPQPGAQSGEAPAQVSPHMTAELYGAGFTVTPPGPQDQLVSATDPTTWSWQVTANGPGQKFLTVVLAAELGSGVRRTTLTEPIAVQVKKKTTLDVMNATVAYLTAVKSIISLLVAIGGFIFAKPVVRAVENWWSSRQAKKPAPP